MAAELGVLSLSQLQTLGKQKLKQGKRSWGGNGNGNGNGAKHEEDVPWDLGSTWPPRSYTCNFCHREFRSAQALGGHMNVHRRVRARLREAHQGPDPSLSTNMTPPIILSSKEFDPIASPGVAFMPATGTTTSLSMGTYEVNPVLNLLPGMEGLFGEIGDREDSEHGGSNHGRSDGLVVEDVDLELRLGW